MDCADYKVIIYYKLYRPEYCAITNTFINSLMMTLNDNIAKDADRQNDPS
jgi:hypothetical protein